jgi:predicted HD phosphohydrolase
MNRSDIPALLSARGHLAYEGEGVTQLQHGWQCGLLARQAGATPALQLAAWLHDLGHLLAGLEGTPTLRGIDDRHEALGARTLDALFGAPVSQPVALHVAAKRYLVGSQPGYLASLSPDSVRSLALQGGPMSPDECGRFMQQAHARDAMRLRTWDDLAKDRARWPGSDSDVLDQLRSLMDGVP